MRTGVPARIAAAEVELCPRCLLPQHRGLCSPCSHDVLPSIARPAWHKDTHRGDRHHLEAPSVRPEYSPGVEKELRKAQRNQARRLARAQAAIGGSFIRNRRSAA